MPLTGNVRDLSLPNLIQLHCTEGRPARIALSGATHRGALFIAAGEIVDADARGLRGEDAVYEMLRWQDAEFHVELDPPAWEQRTINTPWNALVLEGLRRLDEAQAARLIEIETALRALGKQRGVRTTMLVTSEGAPRATSSDTIVPTDAALLAQAGKIAQAVSALWERGNWEYLLATSPTEKIILVKKGDDYLGCWLEGRVGVEPIRRQLLAILTPESH
ncbi:MAG: DUF4388 domain-containing protein [Chloroflexi bacterium]|nr:DUF4388 domain-containing protein [Chloroflexota bacterium]